MNPQLWIPLRQTERVCLCFGDRLELSLHQDTSIRHRLSSEQRVGAHPLCLSPVCAGALKLHLRGRRFVWVASLSGRNERMIRPRRNQRWDECEQLRVRQQLPNLIPSLRMISNPEKYRTSSTAGTMEASYEHTAVLFYGFFYFHVAHVGNE